MRWRELVGRLLTRDVRLFVLFNVIGFGFRFGFSIVTLVLSHDVLGLTSRADNISANVVGLALGTVFRFVTYKRFVFATTLTDIASNTSATATVPSNPLHTAGQTRTDPSAREVPVA